MSSAKAHEAPRTVLRIGICFNRIFHMLGYAYVCRRQHAFPSRLTKSIALAKMLADRIRERAVDGEVDPGTGVSLWRIVTSP
jgi:hypothetical protein